MYISELIFHTLDNRDDDIFHIRSVGKLNGVTCVNLNDIMPDRYSVKASYLLLSFPFPLK